MPRHASFTFPTSAALPGSTRLPSTHPTVYRLLTRLSRSSLLTVVQEWLNPQNASTCAPYLAGDVLDEDSTHDVAQSLEELQEVYDELENGKGGKREIVDRILEGDWRHGVSLRQLAMVDIQYLLDHPTSQKWTALRLVSVLPESPAIDEQNAYNKEDECRLPRFHAPTFVKNLHQEIGILAKAHYNTTRLLSLPITLVRISIFDSPYNTLGAAPRTNTSPYSDASTTLYIAFPDNTPAIYVSLATSSGTAKSADGKSLRTRVIDALPKAISRPQERYTLKTTSLSTRSLDALVSVRGPGSGHAASAGWSTFADGAFEKSPLTPYIPSSGERQYNFENKEYVPEHDHQDVNHGKPDNYCNELLGKDNESEPLQKRRRLIARVRFGDVGPDSSQTGIERLDIRLESLFPDMGSNDIVEDNTIIAEEVQDSGQKHGRSALSPIGEPSGGLFKDDEGSDHGWRPNVQLTFSGSNVFSGIRKLVESGVINGKKMPGWMTGENGVSFGVVRDGKVRGNKGSGLQ